MTSLFEAQELVISSVSTLDSRDVPIENAAGYVASSDIVSAVDVPAFRAATMDGFAVASEMITSFPMTFEVARVAYAGSTQSPDSDPNKAVRIMTGAPVPPQCDSVVPFEDTEFDDNRVTIKKEITPNQYMRQPGDDIAAGEVLMEAGKLIRPLAVGAFASAGLTHMPIVRKPSLLIMSTGDELVLPGQPLEPGQVYDSNSRTLEAITRPFRGSVEVRQSVGDDKTSLQHALESDCDVIVTSGGVSAGDRDYLPSVAKESGWTTILHGVAVKPGKPIFVAKRGHQTLFGLPGNPLSAAVSCALFVLPALKKMMGYNPAFPKLSEAYLDKPSPIVSDRTIVWPGTFTRRSDRLYVTVSEKKNSSAISAVLGSDGLVFLIRQPNADMPVVKAVAWPEILQL